MTEPAGVGRPDPDPPVTVAAFDFDGTLTDGGSVFPFLVTLRGTWPVLRAVVRHAPALVTAALAGGTRADAAKEDFFVRLLGGLEADEVGRRADAFAAHHLSRHLRADTRRQLEWHVGQGHHVVLVSASPEAYVGPAGASLGALGVAATRLAVDGGGRLTGAYEGRNCRGAEKLIRLRELLAKHGLLGADGALPELWAYGNSRGDLRLLRAATHGVDAGRLGRFGRLRHFPRLSRFTDVAGAAGDPGHGGTPPG